MEGLVLQHLRAWCGYTGGHEPNFWRTPSGTEVDFIVYGDREFCCVEFKNSEAVSRKDLRGLWAFLSDYRRLTAHCFIEAVQNW